MNNKIFFISLIIFYLTFISSCSNYNNLSSDELVQKGYDSFPECYPGGAKNAIDLFKKALKKDKKNHKAFVGIADANICLYECDNKKENLKKALKNINKAFKITREDPVTYYSLGNIQSYKNDYKGSIESYSKALNLTPGKIIAENIYEARCHSYEMSGQFDLAIQDQQQVMNYHPGKISAGSYVRLAKLYKMNKDYDQALKYCERALEAKSKFLPAIEEIGHIKTLQCEYYEGIRILNEVLEKNPVSVAYIYLGDTYMHLKEYKKAIKNYKLFLEKVNPDNPDVKSKLKEAQQKLKKLQRS